jgi:hypothetical protein
MILIKNNVIRNSLNFIKKFSTTSIRSSTQFYPINDDVFGLTEEQKQVF